MPIGDTAWFTAAHRVTTADHRERGRRGHRARERDGAGRTGLLEHAHRPFHTIFLALGVAEAVHRERADVRPIWPSGISRCSPPADGL